MAAPKWFKSAIATVYGWAHPLTGEQLTAESNLATPITHYKPNNPKSAFLDAVDQPHHVGVEVRGKRVLARLTSLSPVDGQVTWTISGQDPVVGGPFFSGAVSNFGEYTLTCAATLDDETSVSETINLTFGEETQFPPSVINAATISGNLIVGEVIEAEYAFESHGVSTQVTHQWTIASTLGGEETDIEGAIYHNLTLTEDHVGMYLRCYVLAENVNGTVGSVSDQVGPILAA